MEKIKSKNDIVDLRHYWRFFITLTLGLALMVKFPLRIELSESFWDTVYYGTISLSCLITAIRVYRRYSKHSFRLIAVILLSCGLASWQIVDVAILRLEGSPAHTFASSANVFEPIHAGFAWYNPRFPSDDILCHSIFERYIGNNFIAIAYDIDRNATWFACGG
jgi:hypothetical protein